MFKKNLKWIMVIVFFILIGMSNMVSATNTKARNTVNNMATNTMLSANQMENRNQEENNKNDENSKPENGLGLMAAALATGLSCIGAGIAVAMVASSAIGAISENPKALGKTIIFAGLAEGIAIYGLIISIMILNKV